MTSKMGAEQGVDHEYTPETYLALLKEYSELVGKNTTKVLDGE